RAVLAHLPFDEVAPPPGLEDRVMSAALRRRPVPQPRSRRGQAILAGLAIAALIAALVLVVANHHSPLARTRVENASVTRADVDSVLSASGVRTGAFPNGGRVALAPDGRGYLYRLAPGKVAVALDNLALGTVQPHAGIIALRVQHPELVQAVSVTDA